MSNLETTGVKYIIDDAEVKAAIERITRNFTVLEQRGASAIKKAADEFARLAEKTNLAFNEKSLRFIDTQTKLFVSNAEALRRVRQLSSEYADSTDQLVRSTAGAGEAAETAGGKFSASRYQLRFFASEMVQATGVAGQFGGIVGRLVTALSPLDAALIAVTGAVVLFQQAQQKQQEAFQTEIAMLARVSTSYDAYRIARQKALEAQPLENFRQQVQAALQDFGRLQDLQFKPGSMSDTLKRANEERAESLQRLIDAELALAPIDADRIRRGSESIQKMAEEGASISEINDALWQWKIATGEVSKATLENADALKIAKGETAKQAAEIKALGDAARDTKTALESMARVDYSILLSKRAQRDEGFALGAQVGEAVLQAQEIQASFNAQIEDLAQAHNARMADIEAMGGERRAEIAESYRERLTDIEQNLAQARADAAQAFAERIADLEANAQERRVELAESLAQRIADAEASAQERREQLLQSLADRRAEIERQYQERVRQIQLSYEDSLFEAEAQRDAKAIVNARRTRARQLQEAERQRTEAHADANRDYERQRKELEAALAKQKQTLQRDYQRQLQDLEKATAKQRDELKKDYAKRLRDLDEQARRQRAAAAKAYADQQRDLDAALAKQRRAETDSYNQRRLAAKNAYDQRLTALAQALAKEQKFTEEYVKKVQDAFKKILNPAEYAAFIKALQDAFNARINVSIIPNAPNVPPAPRDPRQPGPYQGGGYVGGTLPVPAILHPPELVLPLSNMARTQQLLADYLAPRMAASSVFAGGRGGGGRVDVYVHPELNEGVLDVKVRAIADNQMVRVFTEAHERTGAQRR